MVIAITRIHGDTRYSARAGVRCAGQAVEDEVAGGSTAS
jgi:hypothetical protein